MSIADPGALMLEVPQTFSAKNWPFAAFLVFLGAVLATPAWLMGNAGIAVALFLGGLGLAFIAFLMQRASALARGALVAVYERGLLVRRGQVSFVPWADLERIERWTAIVEETTDVERTFMKVVFRDGRSLSLGLNPDVHEAVLQSSRLTPVELGRKSSW